MSMVSTMGGDAIKGTARSLLLAALDELRAAEKREQGTRGEMQALSEIHGVLHEIATRRKWLPFLRKKTLRKLLTPPEA